MWLESIKENKPSYFYWGYLGVIGVIFYIMNSYTPLFSDDWHYCFIFGTTTPIETFGHLLKSQYTHYFLQNGRFIPHLFLQLFDGITGKAIFNIANTFIFCLFLHLIVLITKNKNQYMTLTITILTIVIFIPDFRNIFLWMSGACNYLWSATFVLLFHHILFQSTNKRFLIFSFFIGLICGWTHESFTIGLLIGYFFYFLLNKKELTLNRFYMLIGFILGVFLLICSPGSINRAIGHNSDNIDFKMLFRSYIVALIGFANLRIFFILIITVIITYIKNRKYNSKVLINNLIFIITIFCSFFFVWATKHDVGRSRLCIELFSLIIFLQYIDKHSLKRNILNGINISLLIGGGFICIMSHKNYQEYLNNIDQIKSTKTIITFTQEKEYPPIIKRFIIRSIIGDENLNYYYAFSPNNFENKLIAKYYDKESLSYLPQSCIDDILSNPDSFTDFNFKSNYPFYIKKINKAPINDIKFILRPTLSDEIPIIHKPFYKLMERYTATEMNTKEYITINIENSCYILIKKNVMIDNRVIDIIIN